MVQDKCLVGDFGCSQLFLFCWSIAREVMEDWNETGPIRPEHLREAQRRSKLEEVQKGRGVQTPHGYKRRMFCR